MNDLMKQGARKYILQSWPTDQDQTCHMLSTVDMYMILLLIKHLCERLLRSVRSIDCSGRSIFRVSLLLTILEKFTIIHNHSTRLSQCFVADGILYV
jgi:hypothetical protein